MSRLNLAATALLLGTAAAVATPTTATAAAPPAPAPITIQVEKNLGKRCGDRPFPCAWLNLDRANNRLRGYGSLSGLGKGKILVILERKSARGWREVARSSIVTGQRRLQTKTRLEACKRDAQYRTVLKWSRNGSPTRNFVSNPVNVGRC